MKIPFFLRFMNVVVLLLSLAILTSCQANGSGSDDGKKHEDLNSNSKTRPNVDYSQGLSESSKDDEIAYYSLKKGCETIVGASFNPIKKECLCPTGELPDYQDQTCIPHSSQFENSNNSYRSDPITIDFNWRYQNEFASVLESRKLILDQVPMVYGLGGRFQLFTLTVFTGLSSLSAKNFYDLANQSNPNFEINGEMESDISIFLYEVNPIYLPWALGDQTGKKPDSSFFEISENAPALIDNKVPKAFLEEIPRIQKMSREAYLTFRKALDDETPFSPSDFFLRTKQGCLEYCSASHELPLPQYPDVKLEWQKTYASGGVILQNLILRDRATHEKISQIILNYSQTASFILIYGHWPNAPVPTRIVLGFDRYWNQITSGADSLFALPGLFSIYSEALPRYFQDVKQQREQTEAILSDPNRPAITIVSESDFHYNQLSEEKVFDKLLIGPFFPEGPAFQNLKGSILGWIENSNEKISDYIPLQSDDSGIVPADTWKANQAHKSHLVRVMKALTEASDHHFAIPVKNEFDLFDRPEEWMPTALAAAAHVVNVSFGNSFDSFTCKRKYEKVFENSKKDFLWVLGAGNSGGEGAPEYFCPQNIGDRDNLLVVGAMDGSQMAQYSRYGKTYVDIAASGADPNEVTPGGTSFASPRVSAIASEIYRLYPELSPRDVKLAILMGAILPENWSGYSALPVRSGGWISYEERGPAISIAGELEKLGDTLKDQIGKTERGNEVAFNLLDLAFSDKSLVRKKMQILKENGVLFKKPASRKSV